MGVDRRLRTLGMPAIVGELLWLRFCVDSAGDDSAIATSSESAGDGACRGEASPISPSGEVKRLDARAWRSKKLASSYAFFRNARSDASCVAAWGFFGPDFLRHVSAGSESEVSMLIFSVRRSTSER